VEGFSKACSCYLLANKANNWGLHVVPCNLVIVKIRRTLCNPNVQLYRTINKSERLDHLHLHVASMLCSVSAIGQRLVVIFWDLFLFLLVRYRGQVYTSEKPSCYLTTLASI
jgi:hypothetical protein